MKSKLKPKPALFVANYIANGLKDATAAGIAAGYKGKNVRVTVSKLLKMANVQAAIQEALAKQQERVLVDKDRVLKEMACVSFVNIKDAFDANGNLLPLKDMPEDMQRAICSIKVSHAPVTVNSEGEADGEPATITEVKLWDKPATLRDLGKHFRMFVDRIEVNDVTDRAALLAEARKRADEMKDDKPDATNP